MDEHPMINSISDYVSWTETTAIYPRDSKEQAREYEVLGVLSELGEICGMFKRELRDPEYTLERLNLKLELGDIAWYLARIHYNHTFEDDDEMIELIKGISPETAQGSNCFTVTGMLFDHYKPIVSNDAAMIKALLGITQETHPKVGQVVEVLEKLQESLTESDVRVMGHIMELHSDYKLKIPHIMYKLSQNILNAHGLMFFFILCDKLRFEMIDVMRANYRKLEDRKANNTLHDSGSHR